MSEDRNTDRLIMPGRISVGWDLALMFALLFLALSLTLCAFVYFRYYH